MRVGPISPALFSVVVFMVAAGLAVTRHQVGFV